MATLFTRIIDGEIPGRFVWRDDQAVAFLTIAPITPGHTLVVPRAEVDHWLDLDRELASYLMQVSQAVGQAQMAVFKPERVGLIVAGLEVPHCHIHVLPIDSEADLSLARANPNPDPVAHDDAAERLRGALRDQGHGDLVPDA
ncbi:MAG TPA: HIT family protein [Acidimicrobiales bacterium]